MRKYSENIIYSEIFSIFHKFSHSRRDGKEDFRVFMGKPQNMH